MVGPMTQMTLAPMSVPHRVEDTGIRKGLLEDLVLKVLYLHGEMSLIQLSELTCLSLGVIEEIFQFFRQERLCEVKGMTAAPIESWPASKAVRGLPSYCHSISTPDRHQCPWRITRCRYSRKA